MSWLLYGPSCHFWISYMLKNSWHQWHKPYFAGEREAAQFEVRGSLRCCELNQLPSLYRRWDCFTSLDIRASLPFTNPVWFSWSSPTFCSGVPCDVHCQAMHGLPRDPDGRGSPVQATAWCGTTSARGENPRQRLPGPVLHFSENVSDRS